MKRASFVWRSLIIPLLVILLAIGTMSFIGCGGGGDDGGSSDSGDTSGDIALCKDNDSDGYYANFGCGTAVDCDDTNPDIHPNAGEDCIDGIDNDCDKNLDCADKDCADDPVCQSGGSGTIAIFGTASFDNDFVFGD